MSESFLLQLSCAKHHPLVEMDLAPYGQGEDFVRLKPKVRDWLSVTKINPLIYERHNHVHIVFKDAVEKTLFKMAFDLD